jgi:hypothetical protein
MTDTEKTPRTSALPLPSKDYLWECLDYDPDSGRLTWKHRPVQHFKRRADHLTWNIKFAGKPALKRRHFGGYSAGTIDYQKCLAHRVIWKMMTGDEPPQIDHINGVRSDNRFANLRAATNAINCRNAAQRSDNTSGVKGVHWDASRQKWAAVISADRKHYHLGRFDTLAEATAARRTAERFLNFHPNHGRPA